MVAKGSIAAGDNKLDYTSDNSFIEFGVDLTSYHGNHKIVVTNTSTGYSASGYLHSVAPGGETLGDELVTDGDMSVAGSWITYGTWSITDGVARSISAGEGSVRQDALTSPLGKLYKLVFTISARTGGYANSNVGGDLGAFGRPRGGTGTYTDYLTAKNTVTQVRLYSSARNFIGDCDNFSVKQVTDCAATGSLIVSTLGGATRSWTSVDTGFDPNLACTYAIYRVR